MTIIAIVLRLARKYWQVLAIPFVLLGAIFVLFVVWINITGGIGSSVDKVTAPVTETAEAVKGVGEEQKWEPLHIAQDNIDTGDISVEKSYGYAERVLTIGSAQQDLCGGGGGCETHSIRDAKFKGASRVPGQASVVLSPNGKGSHIEITFDKEPVVDGVMVESEGEYSASRSFGRRIGGLLGDQTSPDNFLKEVRIYAQEHFEADNELRSAAQCAAGDSVRDVVVQSVGLITSARTPDGTYEYVDEPTAILAVNQFTIAFDGMQLCEEEWANSSVVKLDPENKKVTLDPLKG